MDKLLHKGMRVLLTSTLKVDAPDMTEGSVHKIQQFERKTGDIWLECADGDLAMALAYEYKILPSTIK